MYTLAHSIDILSCITNGLYHAHSARTVEMPYGWKILLLNVAKRL